MMNTRPDENEKEQLETFRLLPESQGQTLALSVVCTGVPRSYRKTPIPLGTP